jgi:hypothetical protein
MAESPQPPSRKNLNQRKSIMAKRKLDALAATRTSPADGEGATATDGREGVEL